MTPNTSSATNSGKALLEERLKGLDHKNFNWQAWKKGTLLVLKRIFGPDSIYVRELENTDYQYNSWSLRDTAGSEDPVKESVRELLRICITEANLNEPLKSNPTTDLSQELKNILSQYFDHATLAEIQKIASAEMPMVAKEEQVGKIISDKIPKYQTALLGKILLWAANR
ncbi:hypothetical protein [Thermophagus xiamenensis]|uniref:Uncharacterized protein n=1 Tax=Thermophagus xiamenensis TaxID=385682 RepID=A0A1I1VJI5_9BACT|nr:hypothetical protein [Thermophagus xiamenensis]SFD82198.1 hypothetical protein SAMN05444380_102177 [Thermophagus xiamenensis]